MEAASIPRAKVAEQTRTKLDDEVQRELDAILRDEKDKMDRLDEIKILRIISESEYRTMRELASGGSTRGWSS